LCKPAIIERKRRARVGGSARMSEVVPAFVGWPRMPEQGLEVSVDDIL
jgi:hypothetical protein